MTSPRFYLITNDGPRAALRINCHMGNLPASIAIVDRPHRFADVPDGARCEAFFWGTRAEVETLRALWRERLEAGGILGITPDEWAKIQAWAHDPKRPSPVLPAISLLAAADAVTPATTEPVPAKRKVKWS